MSDPTTFTIERHFDCTPAELFAAWTEPHEVIHWWHPHGVQTDPDTIEIDARTGGRYAYTMIHDATGGRFPTAGVYLDVDPPHRLVFTWGRPDDDPDTCPLVEVDISATEHGSRQIFTMTRLDRHHDDIHTGWIEAFDHLTTRMEQHP